MTGPLTRADDALARILEDCTPLPVELSSVSRSIGLVLAADVLARRTQPPWNNSAMDGYAVRSADALAAPVTLRVTGRIFAGEVAERPLGPGEAARIMTGAPLPPGADAVLMQERTRLHGETVELLEPVTQGLNVRRAGEDAVEGERLLPAGTPLGLGEAGLLWGQGLLDVPVHRRPRVGILSTGDELADAAAPEPGKILDSNGPMLAAAVALAGGVAQPLGRCGDDPTALRRALERARGLDVLVTSAGASVGERDFIRRVLAEAGAEERFWRVAIKPGKPVLYARWNGTSVFALPGNPTSALVTFELFVRPALRRLLGHREVAPAELPGRAAVQLRKQAGLRHYLRATVKTRDGALWATPLPTQGSGALRSAASATHLMVLPEDVTAVAPGDPVGLVPLSWMA